METAKPKIYVETSIPSYLAAKQSDDVRVNANLNTTLEWWRLRRPHFELYISELVIAEAGRGDAEAAQRRLAAIDGIAQLEVNQEVRLLGQALISEGPIPNRAEVDAYHIAVAAVNGMDYLLTWNCSHIANAVMRAGIESTCRNHGYEPPVICTPQELMEG